MDRHIGSLESERSEFLCRSGLRPMLEQSDALLLGELGARAPGCLAYKKPDVPLLNKKQVARCRLRARCCDDQHLGICTFYDQDHAAHTHTYICTVEMQFRLRSFA